MEINEFIRTGEAEGWLRATKNIQQIRVSGQNQNHVCTKYASINCTITSKTAASPPSLPGT